MDRRPRFRPRLLAVASRLRGADAAEIVSPAAALTARGESPASHRDGRGASMARRDDREYREYLSEEQRSQRGCIARRMQPEFHHGLLARQSASHRSSVRLTTDDL